MKVIVVRGPESAAGIPRRMSSSSSISNDHQTPQSNESDTFKSPSSHSYSTPTMIGNRTQLKSRPSDSLPLTCDFQPPEKKQSIRLRRLNEVLQSPVISAQTLHELLWLGVPNEASPKIRSQSWKICLVSVPLEWVIYRCRIQTEILVESFVNICYCCCLAVANRKKNDYFDIQRQYFDQSGTLRAEHDSSIEKQIRLDIIRTNPLGFSDIFLNSMIRNCMVKVLFILSIRNPASGYVQGLNDLITPLVVVFLRDICGTMDVTSEQIEILNEAQIETLEAECYWCLSKLLSYIQDHFVFGQPGIIRMKQVVVVADELYEHLKMEGVELFQICFRWMICLLIRELPMNAVIRLWDTYIAEGPQGFSDFHLYVSAVFLVYWSSQLKLMDFQQIILFVQSLPTTKWSASEIESLVAEALFHQFCPQIAFPFLQTFTNRLEESSDEH